MAGQETAANSESDKIPSETGPMLAKNQTGPSLMR
jgi:hypothetical protein